MEPLGINIPEEHPDFLWRDPEEHPHFGKDAMEYEYRSWMDEYASKFESLSVDGVLIFKIGPITEDDAYEATCEKVMEMLEAINNVAPEKEWYESLGIRLEKILEPSGLATSEDLYVDEHLKFSTRILSASTRQDAPIITCSKIFELIKQVSDNLCNEIPMTFKYVYEGAPRTGLFASNDFAA